MNTVSTNFARCPWLAVYRAHSGWRPMTPQNLHAWGPVEWIFLIESVGYSDCRYFFFARAHMHKDCFLKRWVSELILVQSSPDPTDHANDKKTPGHTIKITTRI